MRASKRFVTIGLIMLSALTVSGCTLFGSNRSNLPDMGKKALSNYESIVNETRAEYETHLQFKAKNDTFSPFAASAFSNESEMTIVAVLPDFTKGFYQAWILKDDSFLELGILEYTDPYTYVFKGKKVGMPDAPFSIVLSQETAPDNSPETLVAETTLQN